MDKSHTFNFDGGEVLTRIGASWFISYSYYNFIDNQHNNWQNILTAQDRIKRYNNSQKYHLFWLLKISKMNVKQLNRNDIELSGKEVIEMANKIIKFLNIDEETILKSKQ